MNFSPSSGYDLVPVFTPTMEEMADFNGYMERVVDPMCAGYCGICKVIPPKEWKAHNYNMDDIDFEISTPIKQIADGAKGVFQLYLEESEPTTFKRWAKEVTERAPTIPDNLATLDEQVDFMERRVWKNVAFRAPLYGSDLYGSLFDDPKTPWNLNDLDSVLSRVLKRQGNILPGINSPYLYVGSYKSCFAWHCEDLDLYSINYMHFGSPKVWYTIPFPYKKQFEDLAKKYYPEPFKQCSQFLRHKTTIISPFTLKEHGIKVTRITQLPGEFIITLPGSYHQGFNWDINVNEAVNFATKRWIDIGKNCQRCTCDPDTVRINLDNITAEDLMGVDDNILCDQSLHNHFDPTQFAIDSSYTSLFLNGGLDVAPVPHQLPNTNLLSKYYDEINLSYNYPYNNPTKIVYNHEIDMPLLDIKNEFEDDSEEMMRVISNDAKCLKIRITTGKNIKEEEEDEGEEYTPTKKRRSSNKRVKKEKTSSSSVGVKKQEKTKKQQISTTTIVIKPQHHPLFAKFFSRSRLLRK